MRFKLTLEVIEKQKPLLPLNYQYELSSWIYKVIDQGDPLFSAWLHSKGYISENKQFRLFSFSGLNIPQREIIGDRLLVKSKNCSFIFSTLPDETIQHFICGLFRDRKLSLGDKITNVHFQVQNIEALPEPEFTHPMIFKTISPVIVSVKNDISEHAQYLSPEAEAYSRQIIHNLIGKQKAFCKNERTIEEEGVCFEVISPVKRKKITIKNHTPHKTDLIAYNYMFRLTAPEEFLSTAYYAGVGEKNSQGFGCVEIVRD